MTREDQHQAAEHLDQEWDELVRGRPTETTDPLLLRLHAHGSGEPRPLFVSQLRGMIEVAAQELPARRPATVAMGAPARTVAAMTATSLTMADEPRLLQGPMRARRQAGRMRGLSHAGAIASAAMAAALVIAMLAAVVRYPFGSWNDPSTPSTSLQGTSIVAPGSPVATDGDALVSSADPGRTGVQPGPGPLGIPEIVGNVDVSGLYMGMGDGAIVIVDRERLTAIDAASLETLWAVDLPWGIYTAPAIAGGAIYLGYTEQPDRATEYTLGADHNNQLVSVSLDDGSENWRIAGAGAFPIAPVVGDGIVYAVGSTPDAYRLNAIDPLDGRTIWAAEPFAGPEMPENSFPQSPPYLDMTLAYGDGQVAVNQLYELTVYEGMTGEEVWSQPATGDEIVGEPAIDGDLVTVTNSFQAATADQIASGRVIAYDLRTGEERWTNDLAIAPVADVVVQNGVLYGGAWTGAENPVLTRLDPQSGKARWINPYWDATHDPELDYWWIPDTSAIAGDVVYTVSQASEQGNVRRSLISANGIESGDVRWTVVIDGIVQTAPIVAGGKIYLLTDLYGLQVLGDDPDAVAATPEPGVSDLRTPLSCDVALIDNPLERPSRAEGTPLPAYDRWGTVISGSEVLAFEPGNAVSPEVAEDIAARFSEFCQCSLIGDPRTQFGFFSTDYFERLRALDPGNTLDGNDGESGAMAVFFASTAERLELDAESLQVLPDGRIGGYVHGQPDIYVWFVEEDGVWKIDEFHRIIGEPIEPEPSPSP